MVSVLLNTDTCVKPGFGLATSWTLSGLTAAYDGTAKAVSDGYKIVASIVWVDLFTITAMGAETITAVACVIGTCVETLDAAGARVASTVTDDGNNALCHWIYFTGAGSTSPALKASSGAGWGDTKWLTFDQWGATSGAGIIGSKIKSTGTALTSTYEFALSPATLTTIVAATMTMTWYQPTFAATYLSSALRRYNGGTADADKVKAYCIG